jgi:hypothetical protein
METSRQNNLMECHDSMTKQNPVKAYGACAPAVPEAIADAVFAGCARIIIGAGVFAAPRESVPAA